MNGFWTRPGGGEVKTHMGLCEVLGDLGRISQGRSLQCGHCANLQYPSGTFSHQRTPSLSEHSCRRTAFQTGQCIVTCCPGIIRRFLGHRCLSPASLVSHFRSCTTTLGCSSRETRNHFRHNRHHPAPTATSCCARKRGRVSAGLTTSVANDS